MFGKKGLVRLDPDLLDRARKASEAAGYADVSEFLTRLIEKELEKIEGPGDEKALKERLKGLGYIS